MHEVVRNQDVNWDNFNADSYRKHYFDGELEPEDAWAMRMSAAFYKEQDFQPESIEHAVDVGTGPSLVLPLATAPYVRRYDLLEPGAKNLDYLRHVLSDQEDLERDWEPTIGQLNEFDRKRYANVAGALARCARVRPGAAQELEPNAYGGLTMGFCAESVTESAEECAEIIQRAVRAVKKGWLYVAMHTELSEGYPDYTDDGAGSYDLKKFPSTKVDEAWYAAQYQGTGIRLYRSPITQMRPNYSGTILAMGIVR